MGSRRVFLNFRKALCGFEEKVVAPIVAYARYLRADGDAAAFLRPELMYGAWRNADAHPGSQTNNATRFNLHPHSIHLGENGLIGWGIFSIHSGQLHENISAGATADVFHFRVMKMGGSALTLGIEKQFLRINFRIPRLP